MEGMLCELEVLNAMLRVLLAVAEGMQRVPEVVEDMRRCVCSARGGALYTGSGGGHAR